MLYCKSATSFPAGELKIALLEEDMVNKPELIKRGKGKIKGDTLSMQFSEPDTYPFQNISARLDGIPMQCGMAILHSFTVYSVADEQWDIYLQWVYDILKACGYTKLMATLNEHQNAIVKTLERHAFKIIDEFKNRRSGKQVFVLTKELDAPDAG